MKTDNSNKRISNVIAGILLVFVACIFIAIALGVVGNHLYVQDKMDPLNVGSQFDLMDDSSDDSRIGDNGFVPVAQVCPGGTWDTEKGSITKVASYFDPNFVFPLCVDPSESLSLLDNWYVIYESWGGYVPCTTGTQAFDLYQKGQIITSPGYYIGWSLDWYLLTEAQLLAGELMIDGELWIFDNIWYDPLADCCAYDYWIAIINTDCQNPGCLDSNQWPTVPSDCTPNFDESTTIPGKDVIAELTSTWTGCGQADQCFELILVQILRIPNSRINF